MFILKIKKKFSHVKLFRFKITLKTIGLIFWMRLAKRLIKVSTMIPSRLDSIIKWKR